MCLPLLSTQQHFTDPLTLTGPLIVGITLSAIAVGAAFSAGALAFTTLLLPLMLMMSLGGLLSFGLFAGLGMALVLPKLVFSTLSMVRGWQWPEYVGMCAVFVPGRRHCVCV